MTDEIPHYRIETRHRAKSPKPYRGEVYRNDEPKPLWTTPASYPSESAARAAADQWLEKMEARDNKARALEAKKPRGPADPNQLAKSIVDQATRDRS